MYARYFFVLILLLFFGTPTIFASNSVVLHITEIDKTLNLIQLKKYQSGSLIIVDSIYLSNNSTVFTLLDKTAQNPGLYILTINNKHNIELILSSKEIPSIKGTIKDLMINNIDIKQSSENQLYYRLLNYKMEYEKAMQEIQLEKSNIPYFSSTFYTQHQQIEKKIDSIQILFNYNLSSLRTNFPYCYASIVLIPLMLFPEYRDRFRYETNRAFLQQYYFNTFNQLSPDVIHHYLLLEKLDAFFSDYIEIDKKYQKNEIIGYIYEKVQKNKVLSDFIFDYLLTRFYQQNDDDALQQVYETWNADACELDTFANQRRNFVTTILKHKIGNNYTEIALQDANKINQSLQKQIAQNKMTIVVFWQSSCHTCEQVLPKLHDIYKKYKTKKVEVYAINLDKERKQFQQTIEQKGFTWINVWDESRVAQKDYGILQTPTLFIIDNTGKIVKKNIFGEELNLFLKQQFN